MNLSIPSYKQAWKLPHSCTRNAALSHLSVGDATASHIAPISVPFQLAFDPLLAPLQSQKIASLECLRRTNICVNPLTPGLSPSGHAPRTQKLYAPELMLTEGGRRVRSARWRAPSTCRPRQRRRRHHSPNAPSS